MGNEDATPLMNEDRSLQKESKSSIKSGLRKTPTPVKRFSSDDTDQSTPRK